MAKILDGGNLREENLFGNTVSGGVVHYNVEGMAAGMAFQWQELETWLVHIPADPEIESLG